MEIVKKVIMIAVCALFTIEIFDILCEISKFFNYKSKYYEAKTNSVKTKELGYKILNSKEEHEHYMNKIIGCINVLVDGFSTDPRQKDLPMDTIFQYINTNVYKSFSDEEMKILHRIYPNIELLVSTIITIRLTEALNKKDKDQESCE